MNKNLSKYRLTVDYSKVYLFKKLIDKFKNNIFILSMDKILKFIDKNPKLVRYQVF